MESKAMNLNNPSGNLAVAANPGLQSVKKGAVLRGFGNIFNKELGDWFATKRWWIQGLLWLILLNGMTAFIIVGLKLKIETEKPPVEISDLTMGLQLFFGIAAQLLPLGVSILMQDKIIGEKQSGTVSWILTKPVSRGAFILSKLAANAFTILLFLIVIPALVAYFEISAFALSPVAVLPFLGGLGLVALMMLFYLALVVMLGVLFEQRGPVLGISIGLMFGIYIVAQFAPWITMLYPSGLGDAGLKLALGQGLANQELVSVGLAAGWILVFSLVALVVFKRKEV